MPFAFKYNIIGIGNYVLIIFIYKTNASRLEHSFVQLSVVPQSGSRGRSGRLGPHDATPSSAATVGCTV